MGNVMVSHKYALVASPLSLHAAYIKITLARSTPTHAMLKNAKL